MPIYSWICDKCGYKIDVERKMEDSQKPPEVKCACKGSAQPLWRKLLDISITRWKFMD